MTKGTKKILKAKDTKRHINDMNLADSTDFRHKPRKTKI
jgi:hypothetical protein